MKDNLHLCYITDGNGPMSEREYLTPEQLAERSIECDVATAGNVWMGVERSYQIARHD